MKKILYFISGSIFGIGLIVSGMSNPQKVLSFLDIFGNWDPSLMFVMVGAISITAIYFIVTKNKSIKQNTDKKLLVGSSIFGIGWGLVGICPGPVIVILGSANIKGIIFVIALLIGMFLQNKIVK